MGVRTIPQKYPQLYPQLYLQPNFQNETCTICTTPPPSVCHFLSRAQPPPFNRAFNAYAVRRITRAHGRAALAAPPPYQPPAQSPTNAVNARISRPLRRSGSFYHPHNRSGHTAGENQPCSRTILKPIKEGLKPHSTLIKRRGLIIQPRFKQIQVIARFVFSGRPPPAPPISLLINTLRDRPTLTPLLASF